MQTKGCKGECRNDMRYENTPRPDIEQHYHVRELIERQEKRASDRQDYRDREKQRADRSHEINSTVSFTVTDFWCGKCRKDFKAQAIRQIETDWTNTEQQIAFYRTKHWCGAWCIRFITDKHRDGFYIRSLRASLDRGNHFADTIQPFETNYELLYSKKRSDV